MSESINKVELLAPAGDFTCFMAAINAGADAVYFGGEKFGARAYANNFTEEEIIRAINVAHLLHRRVYLTVNTLVKENEMQDLVPFMKPLYEAGLDGVIVQDVGVFATLKEHFSGLELHASTQMAITGKYGAKRLKEMGACRVVPARELSLAEIKEIKAYTGLEIETFIHGAMCYGYSGQCLFSSILGGRSGNRGRCAGPCRLPYQVKNGKQVYPFSLKDMYTLPLIPKLIAAGIDSFKIEGRMKSPEYVAGVTAMYRKYIDRYLDAPNQDFKIEKQDEAMLRKLYIRSDTCNGYYEKHNGKDMVTIQEPGYSGCAEEVLAAIREQYVTAKPVLPITGEVCVKRQQPCMFTLQYGETKVLAEGATVLEATNRPLSNDSIAERMKKMGDTCFALQDLTIHNDEKSFIPVKELNDLRRRACEQLEDSLLAPYRRVYKEQPIPVGNQTDTKQRKKINTDKKVNVRVGVTTKEQLLQVIAASFVHEIYLSCDLFLTQPEEIITLLEQHTDKGYYVAFPYIVRKRTYEQLKKLSAVLEKPYIKGVLVRNLETLQWLLEQNYQGEYIADASIYCWNKKAYDTWKTCFTRITQPYELNKKELLQAGLTEEKELIVYAYIPLMISANCIQNTMEHCLRDQTGKQNSYPIVDRYQNRFPVIQNCLYCYNILYNTVPMSLHGQMEQLQQYQFASYRIDFTIEDKQKVSAVMSFYQQLFEKKGNAEFPIKEYTNGHYKRGVE